MTTQLELENDHSIEEYSYYLKKNKDYLLKNTLIPESHLYFSYREFIQKSEKKFETLSFSQFSKAIRKCLCHLGYSYSSHKVRVKSMIDVDNFQSEHLSFFKSDEYAKSHKNFLHSYQPFFYIKGV